LADLEVYQRVYDRDCVKHIGDTKVPKCAIGEKTGETVVQIVNDNPGRTSNDLAALTNNELTKLGLRGNLTGTAINSFFSYHPDGQRLAADGKVARERGKMAPQWANSRTPIAESQIKKAGQLVTYEKTGVTYVDQQYGAATRTMNRLAKSLPPSRQGDVVDIVNTLNFSAQTIQLQQATINLLRSGQGQAASNLLVGSE
jgi:hypothetical protein